VSFNFLLNLMMWCSVDVKRLWLGWKVTRFMTMTKTSYFIFTVSCQNKSKP